MKRKIYILILLMLFCFVLSYCSMKRETPKDQESKPVEQEQVEETELDTSSKVFTKNGDLTGDQMEEKVEVVINWYSPEDDNTLAITDRDNRIIYSKKVEDAACYSDIYIEDFDGDRIKDALIALDYCGSGGFMEYYIIHYKNDAFKEIDLNKFDINPYFKHKINDNYITLKSDKFKFDESYVLSPYYMEHIKEQGNEANFSHMRFEPIDVDKDGRYELSMGALFRLGRHYPIADINMILRLKNRELIPINIEVKELEQEQYMD